ESEPASPIVDFKTGKARDYEPFTMQARAVFADDTVDLETVAIRQAPKKHLSLSQDYVYRFLARVGEATMKTIKANADKCSPNAARLAVYWLVDDGAVQRVDSGGSGEEATFALVGGTEGRYAP